MRFIHPDILDRFRELVPSWPWATFPTPPRMICEVSDAVTWCGNYVSLFAERQQPEALAEARSWHRVMIDRVMLLKSTGYHKDRKRAIKRALKELVPRIEFLNAQLTLLNAAYPLTVRNDFSSVRQDYAAARAAHFREATRSHPSIQNADGTSY